MTAALPPVSCQEFMSLACLHRLPARTTLHISDYTEPLHAGMMLLHTLAIKRNGAVIVMLHADIHQ